MEKLNIPEGHQTIMPYLILNGAEKFLEFALNVFNAKEISKHLTEDQKIMHAEIMIGDSTIMFANCNDQWDAQTAGLFIYVASADETYEKALSNGGQTILEPADKEYGRSCGIKDPLGNVWWITSVN